MSLGDPLDLESAITRLNDTVIPTAQRAVAALLIQADGILAVRVAEFTKQVDRIEALMDRLDGARLDSQLKLGAK